MNKSEIFYYVGSLNHKGQLFNVYKNKNHIMYYLKVIDKEKNKLEYPLMEEFIQLNKLFYRPMYAMAFGINQKNERKRIQIIPQIIKEIIRDNLGKIIRVEMVSLASALLLSGCAFAMEPDEKAPNNSEITISQDNDENQDDNELVHDSEIWSRGAMQFYNIDENNTLVYKFPDSTYICRSSKEITEKAGLKEDVTLEDLLEAVNNNNNIPEEYKSFILERITNLVTNKYLEGADWSVFYENLRRLNFKWETPEKIQSEYGDNVEAKFEPETSTMILSEDLDLNNIPDAYVFTQELLHGVNSIELTVTEDGQQKRYVSGGSVFSFAENEKVIQNVGMSIDESLDDLLTFLSESKDREIFPESLSFTDGIDTYESSYVESTEFLRQMMVSMDITYPDLINNSATLYLLKAMDKNEIPHSMDTIVDFDKNIILQQQGGEGINVFDEAVINFWDAYIKHMLKRSKKQRRSRESF